MMQRVYKDEYYSHVHIYWCPVGLYSMRNSQKAGSNAESYWKAFSTDKYTPYIFLLQTDGYYIPGHATTKDCAQKQANVQIWKGQFFYLPSPQKFLHINPQNL